MGGAVNRSKGLVEDAEEDSTATGVRRHHDSRNRNSTNRATGWLTSIWPWDGRKPRDEIGHHKGIPLCSAYAKDVLPTVRACHAISRHTSRIKWLWRRRCVVLCHLDIAANGCRIALGSRRLDNRAMLLSH